MSAQVNCDKLFWIVAATWNVRLSNRSLYLNPWISITDSALNYPIYFDWTHATLSPFLLSDSPLNDSLCLSYLTLIVRPFWANNPNEGAMGEPSVSPSSLSNHLSETCRPSLHLNSKMPYHNYSINVHLRWGKQGFLVGITYFWYPRDQSLN